MARKVESVKTEEDMEQRLNESYYVGRASALEDMAKHLRTSAGELWSRSETSFDTGLKATTTRDIAVLLEVEAKRNRDMQKKCSAG